MSTIAALTLDQGVGCLLVVAWLEDSLDQWREGALDCSGLSPARPHLLGRDVITDVAIGVLRVVIDGSLVILAVIRFDDVDVH